MSFRPHASLLSRLISPKSVGPKSLALLAPALLLWATGCEKSAQPKPDPAPPAATTNAPVAKADRPNYMAEIKPVGEFKAGKEGAVEVHVAAKKGYHINAEYPFSFKPKAGPGITFKAKKFGRKDGKFGKEKGVIRVPVTLTKSGKSAVEGLFKLSVCSDQTCEMGRENLRLSLNVKP